MSAVKNFTILFLFLFVQIGFACTGILIKTQNGATITGRTLEFGFDVKSNILVIPKGIEIYFFKFSKRQSWLQNEIKIRLCWHECRG